MCVCRELLLGATGITEWQPMDGEPAKDGEMDTRGEPASPSEKVNFCLQIWPIM